MTTAIHSAQLDFLGPRPPRFDGWTFREELDRARLTTQLRRVLFELLDHRWHSLRELALLVGGSETGTSARLRDLRNTKGRKPWPGFKVDSRRLPGSEKSGVWQYRIPIVTKDQVEKIFGNGNG